MRLKKMLVPEAMYNDIYEISAEELVARNKKGVIFDIDNTVAPYEIATPTDEMKAYFSSLVGAGLRIAFVSNNKHDRARIFTAELGFFFVSDASKPSPKGILRCIDHLECTKEEALLVGDQIFTDCLAAHRAGIECFLVKPIKDKPTAFFRLKRRLEKPFIKIYTARKAKKAEKEKEKEIKNEKN
ncbi:MAG: YqeG family HAD IIIA-type phosphatase [Clostridia bacterium]|nr:YqeG family HAD IIIA-type phosphatase [Clostridia bacterium]